MERGLGIDNCHFGGQNCSAFRDKFLNRERKKRKHSLTEHGLVWTQKEQCRTGWIGRGIIALCTYLILHS